MQLRLQLWSIDRDRDVATIPGEQCTKDSWWDRPFSGSRRPIFVATPSPVLCGRGAAILPRDLQRALCGLAALRAARALPLAPQDDRLRAVQPALAVSATQKARYDALFAQEQEDLVIAARAAQRPKRPEVYMDENGCVAFDFLLV